MSKPNRTLEELESLVERQEREAERLLGISGSFAFVMDEEEIAIALLREISDADVDRCVIAVFEDVADRDPTWLELVAQYDLEQGELGLLPTPVRLDVGDVELVQRILLDKEPIVIPDVSADRALESTTLARLLLEGMSSVAVVPLIVMGWPIGALLIARRTPYDFTPAELRYYQLVVNLAAMALRAVHLIEEQKRTAAEQNAVNRVSQGITKVLNLSEVLTLVYEQINTVIDARDLHIALYDPFLDEISFPFCMKEGQPTQRCAQAADQGLTGYVLQTQKPLLLAERVVDRAAELGIEIGSREARSWMGAPMQINDKAIGVIAVQDEKRENAYTSADLNLLASLASQVAVAIHNARLYENVQHQAIYLRLTAEVGRWITMILDVDELLSQVVELICTGFGFYHVDVWLVDAPSGEVAYRAGTSSGYGSRREVNPRLKVGQEGIVGWVAGNGRPLLVNDVHQDARYKPWSTLPDTRSELAVPISAGGAVIGVLNVESDARNAFHPEDMPMMQTLADQVAVAIHNAQRFCEQEQCLEELEALVRGTGAERS